MTDHRAQERTTERAAVEARPEQDRTSELPTRKGGYERMAAEALRVAEAPAKAAAASAQDEIGNTMTRLMQETTRGLRAAMMLPMAPSAGFAEVQEAMAELVTGMMRNNIRLAQDLMKIYSPQEHAELMQSMMRQWLDAAVESQTAMLRIARQTTDQALRPLEAQAERPRGTTH